ncbi:MAG: PIN domain-containing protein [Planctomycetes bacterium]|nr:PIN domain-containing protein [Planctomycetota bacterium]
MLLPDSNVWVALAVSRHIFHPAAQTWFRGLKRRDRIAFCRATQQTFLRLLTTEAVLAPHGLPPLTNQAAWSVYEGFRANERVVFADEPRGLELVWGKLARTPKASPKLWMDAYLAAFAISGGHEFVTTDSGFTRFKGLEVLVLSRA